MGTFQQFNLVQSKCVNIKKKFCTEHTNKIKCKNDNKYNKILYTSKKLITKDIKIRIKENKRKEIY